MLKRLLLGVAIVATVSTTFGALSVNAKHENNVNEDKITICHRTNSASNPYVIETVSKNAANGGGHDDHTSHSGPVASSFAVAVALKSSHTAWGDIIPAYTWNGKSYPGLNWTAEGQAIYDEHCSYPTPAMPVAMIDYDVICDFENQRAKITLSNAGDASGSAIVNGSTVIVGANNETITHISTPTGKVRIVIKIEGLSVYDAELDCRSAGQGGVVNPTPTPAPTPVVATPSPIAAGAGQSAAVATPTTSKEAAIASLPYTAGNGLQSAVLIASLAAILTAIIAVIAKKTYLKQV